MTQKPKSSVKATEVKTPLQKGDSGVLGGDKKPDLFTKNIKLLRSFLPELLGWLVLLLLIILLRPPVLMMYIIILLALLLIEIFYKKNKHLVSISFNLLGFSIGFWVIMFLFKFLGGLGIIGGLLILVIIALLRMHARKEFIREQTEELETFIFGKPLKRDLWKPGELKRKRFKFKW